MAGGGRHFVSHSVERWWIVSRFDLVLPFEDPAVDVLNLPKHLWHEALREPMADRTPDLRSSLTPRSRSADALAKILRLHPRLPRALRLEEEPSSDAGPAGHMGTYSLETTAGGELAWRHTRQPNKWLVFMGECWCAP